MYFLGIQEGVKVVDHGDDLMQGRLIISRQHFWLEKDLQFCQNPQTCLPSGSEEQSSSQRWT